MPIALAKYSTPYRWLVRDVRPVSQRLAEYMDKPQPMAAVGGALCLAFIIGYKDFAAYADIVALIGLLFFRWAYKRPFHLPFKIPKYANIPDPRNPAPGKSGAGKSEGILFIGNTNDKDNPDFGQEIWFTKMHRALRAGGICVEIVKR